MPTVRSRRRFSQPGGGFFAVGNFKKKEPFRSSFSFKKEMSLDKRTASRSRVLKAGTIEFDGGAVNCMVRNMSEIGAMLDVAISIGIPDHFTLALQTEGLRKYCRIVWWNEKRIGVAFY
jgi:hypothetical protein